MQLAAVPVQRSATDIQHLDLYLSINFNEHWEPLLGGRVKFGLQGGTLELNLENCEIPLVSRQLVGDFNLHATEESQQNQNSTEVLSTENLPQVRDDRHPHKIAETIDQTDCTSCHVSTIGDETSPAWIFELERGSKPVLKGALTTAKLGELVGDRYRVDATFQVTKSDIYLTDIEGLWPHDITPNQHSVLERILTVYLQANKFQPALSWALLSCELPMVEKREVESVPQAEAQLQEMVDRIIAAKTDNFAELAKIANLNPALDFAGANLRGTTLSAVDFSSAKLDRANFRGADLSDADLSDANLQKAKFSGADLSGAFLGNADLKGADLHKASLALANLSGANLGNANLVEVNLTNANLGGANVEAARFGNNSGISEEMQVNLQQRGAIFE
jgi:Pentapeptide repeats (8 copies)